MMRTMMVGLAGLVENAIVDDWQCGTSADSGVMRRMMVDLAGLVP